MSYKAPCIRCESVGREPNEGTIPVRYGPYDGFICEICEKELEEEDQLYYASFEEDEN